MSKLHVITGGPGTGKTAIINELRREGYSVIPEVARGIAEEQLQEGSDVLPWKNLGAFQRLVAEQQLKLESECKDGEYFLDRGLIDGYAYCMYYEVPPPALIEAMGYDRYDNIFLLDLLPNYTQDDVRREDEGMRKIMHRGLEAGYIQYGYDPITVPVMSIEERVRFILDNR